ncbi:MAG: Multidrug resistance protein MexA precursor [Candidatus Hinthialibacteria bacterium OLB16]|nr:MAG: Multidrug resistance protein MexA precursor [Candidatus Hinthialibacteria bacterium OLB16]
MRKRIFSSNRILILLAATGLISGCTHDQQASKSPAASNTPPPAVVVAAVEQKTVPIYRELTARTDASASVELRARVEGILLEQLYEEGKPVKKGQVLIKIDPLPFLANLQSAQAKMQKAEADLAFAQKQVTVLQAEAELAQARARLIREEKELERTTALTRQGVQTPQDLETATAREQSARAEAESREAQLTNARLSSEANIEQASAGVEIARANITQATLDLSYCTISAPFDGLIGLSQVDAGNLVGRGEPTLLATISALDPIRVYMGISEADYLNLARRAEAGRGTAEFEMILADGSIYPHKGRFIMADRAVDLKTGTLSIVAEFPNPGFFIRPGQFARMRVAVEQVENALLVPQKAVVEQQSAKTVYVVDAENKVAFKTITIGDRHEQFFIITGGLAAGEKVIVEGQMKVRPGMVVAPADKPLTEEKAGSGEGH